MIRNDEIEVSVVMPCLNEARTLGRCITTAQRTLAELGLDGEVIVADNGSTDGSPSLARELGATVVPVAERGYGHAYRRGLDAARGRYLVMGDSDDSYDFGELGRFVERLRAGGELVMGSRFNGRIDPGAMPWLHRYVGNPILTAILNLLYGAGVSDAHCGMRGLTRATWQRLSLVSGGMEFASEMVIRAAQVSVSIDEVPVSLRKDGRDRAPHLRSFRDGWRHLRLMLLLSPSWLFLVPSMLMMLLALPLLTLPFCDVTLLGHHMSFHWAIAGAALAVVGLQLGELGVAGKVVLAEGRAGDRLGEWVLRRFRPNLALAGATGGIVTGAALAGSVVAHWLAVHAGPLTPRATATFVVGVMLLLVGVQLLFGAFFLALVRGARSGEWAD